MPLIDKKADNDIYPYINTNQAGSLTATVSRALSDK